MVKAFDKTEFIVFIIDNIRIRKSEVEAKNIKNPFILRHEKEWWCGGGYIKLFLCI